MTPLKPKDVTVSRVRQLSRALAALEAGDITFGKFTGVVRRWVAGHDVSQDLYGNESVPDRLQLEFGGQSVGPLVAAARLDVGYHTAATALSRMCRDGRARRAGRGVYAVRRWGSK